jgi:DNA-directed RNA polymerase subunit RPC12/RpoP
MKIIKPGRLTPPQKSFKCTKCQCEFLADENDMNQDPRDGDFVICPTCGHTIGWSLGATTQQKQLKK